MSLRNCIFGLFAHNAIVRRRSPAPLFAHAWRILPKVAIAIVWTSLTICRRTRGNPSCASHHRFSLSSFFLFFTCWPCPSFLLIFNTFSNSFSDFPSYFVYQRRHFLHKMLFTLRFWHTSPRRNHCCGLNPLCFTIDLKKKHCIFTTDFKNWF